LTNDETKTRVKLFCHTQLSLTQLSFTRYPRD